MREVDFLPDWYVGVRRQRALLTAQTWLTAGLVMAGLAVLGIVRTHAGEASAALAHTEQAAEQATKSVQQLDQTLALQQQLVAKQQVLSDVGLGVEASRVIAELAAHAPRELCFENVEIRTDEQARQPTIADRARAGGAAAVLPAVSRRLLLRITGVAPTEDAITTFWSQLMQRPWAEEVRIVNTAEDTRVDHTVRTFELTLTIPLDAPAADALGAIGAQLQPAGAR